MRWIWLIPFIFFACASVPIKPTPPYHLRRQHTINSSFNFTSSKSVYSDQEIFLYTEIFLECWRETDFLPQSDVLAWMNIEKLVINWEPDVFTYRDPRDGVSRLLGLTDRNLIPGKIAVFVATHYHGKLTPIEDSAYGHELMHVLFGAITGDSQHDHLQNPGAIDWPPKYEQFLKKVGQEYRKRYAELHPDGTQKQP